MTTDGSYIRYAYSDRKKILFVSLFFILLVTLKEFLLFYNNIQTLFKYTWFFQISRFFFVQIVEDSWHQFGVWHSLSRSESNNLGISLIHRSDESVNPCKTHPEYQFQRSGIRDLWRSFMARQVQRLCLCICWRHSLWSHWRRSPSYFRSVSPIIVIFAKFLRASRRFGSILLNLDYHNTFFIISHLIL